MSEPPAPPPSPAPPRQSRAVGLAFGWLLTVLGGLWTLLAGGCSALVLMFANSNIGGGRSQDLSGVLQLLALDAAILAPGVAMLVGGIILLRSMWRRPPPPSV